jgi:hypothetical protein
MLGATYDALRRKAQKTLGKPNNAAVGPDKSIEPPEF